MSEILLTLKVIIFYNLFSRYAGLQPVGVLGWDGCVATDARGRWV